MLSLCSSFISHRLIPLTAELPEHSHKTNTPTLLLLKNNKALSSAWNLFFFLLKLLYFFCTLSIYTVCHVFFIFPSFRSWRVPSLFWASWSRRQETSVKPQSPAGRSINGDKRSLNSLFFDRNSTLDSALLTQFILHSGLIVIYLIDFCRFFIPINVFLNTCMTRSF